MLLKKSFKNKNILILGYGKSGQSASQLLHKLANQIFVYDQNFCVKILKNNKNKLNLIKNNYFFEKNIFFENNLKKILQNNKINFCIVSPGISIFSKEVSLIKKHKIRLLGELELGTIFARGKIFAITGTNGKTTTAHALFHVFQTAKKHAFLCGNVGTPITQIAPLTTKNSLLVVEVSSFQMETTHNFQPYASVILNLQPDHIDRHKTFHNYAVSKNKINGFFGTKKHFYADNATTKKLGEKYFNSRFFSKKNKKILKNNLFLIKNNIFIGKNYFLNLLAASLLAKEAGIPDTTILKANQSFRGLEHRLQFVGKKQNITFVNDSKATNPASTIFALENLDGKIILLLGGSSKNLSFAEIAKKDVFAVVGFGEVKEQIRQAFSAHSNFFEAEHLEDAFLRAVEIAQSCKEGCTVLLSPASASFDEFKSFEHRGDFFVDLAKNFLEKT